MKALRRLGAEELRGAYFGPGVYFLLSGRTVVYIGQSKRVSQRLAGHGDKQFDAVWVLKAAPEDLNRLESNFIAIFVPRLNRWRPGFEFEYLVHHRNSLGIATRLEKKAITLPERMPLDVAVRATGQRFSKRNPTWVYGLLSGRGITSRYEVLRYLNNLRAIGGDQ